MKNVSENLLKVWGHVGFLMFSHLQHKIFVAETKKKKNSNCNQFHNILRLFDVFANFIFTTSGTMGA